MKIIKFTSPDDLRSPELNIPNCLQMTEKELGNFELLFEKCIIGALEMMQLPERQPFTLIAGVIVAEAKEEDYWHTGYGPTLTAKKGQWFLRDSVCIWLEWKTPEARRPTGTLLLARTMLGWLYNNCYKPMVLNEQDIQPDHHPIMKSEVARFLYHQVRKENEKTRTQYAVAAAESQLKYNAAMEGYERLRNFAEILG